MWLYLTSLFQAQSRYESQFSQAALPTASPLAPPPYPLNPENVPASAGSQRSSIYPGLSDFMGLDISPQALAELSSQYAVAIPQPVSVCHVDSLSRIMSVRFSLSWKPGMLELQDVSSKCPWSTCLSVLYRMIKKSLHLMITIQKVTSNVQSVPHPSPDICWHAELCSWRPCSVYHGPHSEMYSAMAIFKSSVVWGLFEYTESGAQRLFDHPVVLTLARKSNNQPLGCVHCYKGSVFVHSFI
jgi:hypothetical protein